ncbi:MAG TPA: hypothetical protein VFP65_16500 [Anaeromyxobacteraceae bacterium]|nr:hypothetical protein [Anaeromyxobacteraceae bacterium]
MPVSKKRKKDGKPVQRHGPATEGEAHADHPEGHPAHGTQRAGKPKNPFVAQKSQVRGAQRGR